MKRQVQPLKYDALPDLIKIKCEEFETELISRTSTLTETEDVLSIISRSNGDVIYSLKDGSIKKFNQDPLQTEELFKSDKNLFLILSNDENYICAFGETELVHLIDDTGISALTGHHQRIKSANFSEDSKLLITASLDNTSIIWDVITHLAISKLVGHTDIVNSAKISKDNRLALTCSNDSKVLLWSISSPEMPQAEILAEFKGHTSGVNDSIFSTDESLAISSANDNTIRIWSFATQSLKGTLRGHTDNVNQVFNITSSKIVSLGDLSIRVWNIETKTSEAVMYGHTSSPEKIIISSKYFYTCASDKTIRVWDKHLFTQMAIYKGHDAQISALNLSKDGKRLYSCGYDKMIKIWNVDESYLIDTLNYHPDFVVGVAITKDNKWIISGGGGGVIAKWDAEAMTKEGEFLGHTRSVFRLAFVKNDTAFLSASGDKSLKMWDFNTGDILFSKVGHDGIVYFLGLPDDESYILTGGFDYKIVKWNFDPHDSKGNTLTYLTNYDEPIGNKKERGIILSFAISKDCKTVISVGRDRCIRFWDTHALAETNAIDRQDFYEVSVAISNDDSKFATGSQDSIIRLWSMKELCIIGVLPGHLDKVDVLKFLESGSHLISGSSDTSIRIWNLGEMSFEAALEGHSDRVRNLCLSDDESLIVSASTDHSVKVWKYFVQEPEPNMINFQGVKDQWKGLFALTYLKAKPETWMKYIYIQPYRVNRLHIYCHTNNQKDLEIALSKGCQLMTTSDGEHPLSIAIKENSADCVDQILSYLCGLSVSSPYMFENIIIKISPIFPRLLNYSPSNIKMFLDTLMILTNEGLPTLAIPVETLPKIILTNTYSINSKEFVKEDSAESGKLPIKFFKSSFVWNLEIGSSSSIELLESIYNCKILHIHETKFIQNLINFKWNKLWAFILIQTIFYWTSLVFFALTVFDVENRKVSALILLVFTLILSTYEGADIVSKSPYYFKKVINWVDLTVYSGTIIWSIIIIANDVDPSSSKYILFSWILGLMQSLRGITYFRTFKPTRFYMRMIIQAVIDTYSFILILIYSTLCFAIIEYLSIPERDELSMSAIGSSIIRSYSMNLSDFNQPQSILSSITFIIQSCINIIIIFNLLISILASSHRTFEGVSAMHNYKEMLEIIIEIEKIMMWKRNLGSNSSIQCCEMSVTFEDRNDIVENIRNFTEKKLRQLEDTEKERHEENLTEFTRLRTDIGNIYAILTKLK